MSWFGDSLNNIKGQISSIAKEVLAEGADEVDDHEAQLKLANDKIKSLEASSASYTAEIARLEALNGELEQRLNTSDLQLSTVSQRHRQQVLQQEKEILSLRNQLQDAQHQYRPGADADKPASDDDDDGGDAELEDLASAQRRLRQLSGRLRAVTRQRDQLLSQTSDEHQERPESGVLQDRVQELEQQLQESVDRHQEQLSALQDSHQLQLQRLRTAEHQESGGPDGGDDALQPAAELAAELRQLSSQRDGLLAKLRRAAAEKESAAERLEAAAAERDRLKQTVQELTAEKDGLVVSLEELDQQNQAAIDQLQRWRTEATSANAERDQLQGRLQQAETAAEQLSAARDALQAELQQLQRDVTASVELQEQLQAATTEKARLETELEEVRAVSTGLLNRVQEEEAETASRIDLKQKLHDLETLNAALAAEKDEALGKLKDTCAEVEQLKEERDVFEKRSESSNGENEVLRKARDDLLEKMKEMKTEIQHFTECKNDLSEKLHASETSLFSVRSENEKLLQSHHELAEDASSKHSLEAQLAERDAEIRTLQVSKEDALKTLEGQKLAAKTAEDELTAENKELQERIEVLQGDVASNVKVVEKMKQELTRAENKASKVQDDKRVLEEHLEYYTTKAANDMQEKVVSLQKERQALMDRCEYLELISQTADPKTNQHVLSEKDEAPLDFSEVSLTESVPVREEPDGQDTCNKEADGTSLQVLQSQLEAEQRRLEEEARRNSELQAELDEERSRAKEAVALCSQLQSENETLENSVRDLKSKRAELECQTNADSSESLKKEEKHTVIRLLQILTQFNSDDIYASNSSKASLLDSLEAAVQDMQWRLQELTSELEEERGQLQQAQEQLQQLQQEQLLAAGSSEKLETISEDAERVVELEAELSRLQESTESVLGVSEELSESRQLTETLQLRLTAAETAAEREEQLRYEKEEQIIRVQTELAEVTLSLDAATVRVAAEAAELTRVKDQLEAVTREKENLCRQVEDKERDIKGAQERHDLASAENSRQLEQLGNEKLSLQAQCDALVSEKIALAEARQELATKVEQLSEQLGKENSQNMKMNLELSSLRQDQTEAKATSEKYQILQAEVEALKLTAKTATEVCHVETETSPELLEESARRLLAPELQQHSAEQQNLTQQLQTLTTERESQSTGLGQLTTRHQQLTAEHQQLSDEHQQLANRHDQLTAEHQQLSDERQQLITALSQKHSESVQYHGEIQRLQAQLAESAAQLSEAASQLTQARAARDQALAQAQQQRAAQDQLLVTLQERNRSTTELQTQVSQLEESEQRLQAELRRLRDHLVAIEDNYTQEAVTAEQRERALRERLASEQQCSADSEAASKKIESLQEQLSTVSQQRDDVTLQLDDVTNSLNNLQRVLEQFQREKHREIELATSAAERDAAQLRQRVETLKGQLQEASDGLSAADRLNQQLDRQQDLILALKADVEAKVDANVRLTTELEELKGSTSGRVDRTLVKNLVLGLVSAPTGHEREVLRVIATVLDFSREERIRARLDPAPAAAAAGGPSSLSQAFVRFLEAESTPRRSATLPAQKMAEETARRAESRQQQRAPPLVAAAPRTPPPPPLSTGGHSRQSSSGSSNLLLDVPQTDASSSSVLRAIMDGTEETADAAGAGSGRRVGGRHGHNEDSGEPAIAFTLERNYSVSV